MAESLPILSTTSKGDNERDKKGTPENGKKGLSLSQCIVREIQKEPDRPFVVRDLVVRTGGSYASVKRILSRLSLTGKGAGPVRRIAHGLYQYDPSKEQDSLQALVRSDNWKFENIRFTKRVPLGAQGGAVSLSETVPEQAKGTPSDSLQPSPHPNVPYPWNTPTGHLVTWEDYVNGTQVISISANGAPPLSPDTAILLISSIRNFGMDDSWNCTSIEANIDSRYHRFDGSYSLQLIEGVLLKAYQHGYNARIEVADGRTVPMREVMDLFHAIAGGFNGQSIIREQRRIAKHTEEQVTQSNKKAELALNIATMERDKRIEAKHGPKEKKTPAPSQPPSFKTGTEIKQERATTTAPATAPGSIQ